MMQGMKRSGPPACVQRVAPWLVFGALAAGCGSGESVLTTPKGPSVPDRSTLILPQPPADPVGVAERALEASRYDEARERLAEAAPSARCDVARAELALATGAYEEAAEIAAGVSESPEDAAAACAGGEALRRLGRHDAAEQLLRPFAERPEARCARLRLAEVLLDQGRAADAEPLLMTFIEAYNERAIDDRDPLGLAMVGRAAHLLGSVHDANDAFNESERAGKPGVRTLLWRAALFLENYDTGHAAEVLTEALARAPRHPEALVGMAHVKLDEQLDFAQAAALADRALAVDPHFAPAHVVHAGIALRDLEFETADAHLDRGAAQNPANLEIGSMRAAVRFLADDREGFRAAKRAVLDRNAHYSRLYQIIGDYADWEHRYEEIVELMREALLANPGDPKVRAQLGINLIRSGEEQAGVKALRHAFVDDPFNVRVYNTLELFEKTIPGGYVSVPGDRFVIRYSKEERDLLERYVPPLLDRAYAAFTRSYRFTPREPTFIELYPVREHFAVRTSGLPQTYIQGVCFGRTLAAISPRHERFNFGMTLWHELAHVFHIQLSKSRVPRWFTEGLAEYETLVARPEWKREHDPDLYDAFRSGRLPEVARMNQAFSHARDMRDMATAYYASAQIVTMLAERYGRPKLRHMLVLWGEGKRTPDVLRLALGRSPQQIDQEFRAYAEARLEPYTRQFVPIGRPDDVAVAKERVKQDPRSTLAAVRLAHALAAEGDRKAADRALDRALALDPKEPDALFLAARRALDDEDLVGAKRHLDALVSGGRDGYEVQMALARVARVSRDRQAQQTALERAHAFDRAAAGPLVGLAALAERTGDTVAQTQALRTLAGISEHEPGVVQALMRRLIADGKPEEARTVGQGAIYTDMQGLETHALYATALERTGDLKSAVFELESATLSPGPEGERVKVHERLAALLKRLGRTAEAETHVRRAAELGPR
jgi:cellulose synthase operon protein C